MRNRFAVLFALFALWVGANMPSSAGELPGGWASRDAAVRSLLVSVSFANDQVGWACGIRAITRTVNGGKTWQGQWTKGGDESYWFNSVVALSPQVAMVSGFPYGRPGGGIVLRTEDGGATWKPVTVSTNPQACYTSLCFRRDGKTGFVISNTDGLLRTDNGGLTWTRVNTPNSPTRTMVATNGNISLPDAKTIVVGGDGALLLSTDNGKSWQSRPLPAGVVSPHRQFFWVNFSTPEHGWVNLLGGDTLETNDGGLTWTKSTAPGRVMMQDEIRGWAIGNYEIARTIDGGATWLDKVQIGGGQSRLVAVAVTGSHAVVVGGSEGTGTSFIADHLLPGVVDQNALPAGVVPITFTMPAAGYATIQILNAKGEVVQNVATGRAFPAGKQTVLWDLSTMDDYWTPFTKSSPYLYTPPVGVKTVAAPGQYRWRGIWHSGLTLDYMYSYYPLKPDGLAWITPDGTGGWLGDHAPPLDVVRGGETMWVGTFCEAGHALLEADTQMHKLWGTGRIQLACPKVMAIDGENLYFVEEGGWLGFSGHRLELVQVTRKSKASRRLFAIGEKDARAELAQMRNITGLAVIGNRAYIAAGDAKGIIVCDLTENIAGRSDAAKVERTIALEKPGRIRPYDATRLAAVSGTRVVLIDRETDAVTPLVTGLTNPFGLAVDTAGNCYVGEMDPVHQVKVYSPQGKLLRTLGKPGKHRVGPFEMDNLESPSGIDIDTKGNVWVCENSSDLKRTSVWDAQGRCINQVVGPTVYGGDGEIDPADANHVFYEGKEFRRDPQSGKVQLVNIMWRYDDTRYDQFATVRPHNFGGPAPSYPFWHNGKLFFSMWGGYGMGEVTTLWVYDKDHVRPVAAVGSPPEWLRTRMGEAAKGMKSFAWTDRNDDGKAQPAEVAMGPLDAGGAVWGVRMNANFEVAFSTVAGDVGAAFFRVASLTPQGYPVYALPTAHAMVKDLRVNDPSQVQTVYMDRMGNAILNTTYLVSLRPDGTINWRYPNRWPGLHAGLNTTANGTEAGVIIAPLRFYGSGVVNDTVGEVICLGTNFGATDLITEDGLYVGRAFQDSRRADAWAYNTPPTPEMLAKVSLGQEHFGGTFQRVRGSDGQYHFLYVVSGGGPSCNVVELKGLETIRRFPDTAFTVTPQQCLQAELLRQQRAAQVIEQKRYTIAKLANMNIDGKAAEWPRERMNGFALGYDATNLYVYYEGKDDRAVFQNAATAAQYADAFKTGDVVDVMLATKGGLSAERQNSGEGDIRLSLTMVDGKPAAILYDYLLPGTPKEARLTFSSPWQSLYIDKVALLPEARIAVTRTNDGFTLEAAIPLTALHLNPAQTPSIRGDVGLVVSDQTGTRAVDRIYWSNPNTKTVADVPTEARLQPNLWAEFDFAE